MPWDNFDLSKDDTKLVMCNNTVYKVKVLPQRSYESDLPCSIQEANRQIEEVFRAVLYMDQRSVIFKSIHTKDFIITTKKKNWKTSQKLSFQSYGKPLKACPYQFILYVDLKNKSFIKEDQSERQRKVQVKTNTTKLSHDETVISHDNKKRSCESLVESHDTKTKSCERSGDATLRTCSTKGGTSNSDKAHENNVNESCDKDKNNLEIVDSYKKVKNFKDLTDNLVYNDKLIDELDSEKRKNILLEKIRERERKKKEELRKKQELEKLFTNFQSASVPGKRKQLYKAEVYCQAPGSVDGKVYNTRRSRNVKKPNGDETEGTVLQESDDSLEIIARSKTSSPSCEIQNCNENEKRPVRDLENIGSTSIRRTLRSRTKMELNMQQYDKDKIEQQRCDTDEQTHGSCKIKTGLPPSGRESARLKKTGLPPSGRESARLKKTGLPPSGRESARLKNKKVVSDVKDKHTSSYQDSSASMSSESEERLIAPTKVYPLRSRAKSLSPYGSKITECARSESSYNENKSAKKSPKIDLFRPYQSFGNESERLENLRTTSLNQKKSQLVSRKQIDRHEVEKAEIEESMKLQKMSKSLSPQISPKGTCRKRKSTGFWNLVDSLFMPVKRVFKG